MPILPLVDLLILMGSASLLVGFLLKAIALSTIYRPSVLGFTSLDFVLIAGVCLALALVLVARTWLKLHEPNLLALQSRLRHEQARQRAIDLEQEHRAHARVAGEAAADAGSPRADVAGVQRS